MKLIAGSGGKGVCSFHSEPRKEWGGPDGGNGGDGGSIIIKGKSSTQKKLTVECLVSFQSSVICQVMFLFFFFFYLIIF